MTHRYTRRRLLERFGIGSAFIGCLGQRLISTAWGATGRKNLIVYANVNGLVRDHAPTVGAGPSDFALGSFDDLNPIKDQITWIQHLNNPRSLQLHGNWWSLTGETSYGGNKDNDNPGGPSIDRLIAHRVGMTDAFSSLSFSTDEATNVQGRKARAGAAGSTVDQRTVEAPLSRPFTARRTPFLGSSETR